MDGWKPVERLVEGAVLLDQAVPVVEARGFEIRTRTPGYVVLQRPGTQVTVRGERFPLELALAETEEGIFLQLRYDTFVAFDTGDLQRLADELASALVGVPADG